MYNVEANIADIHRVFSSPERDGSHYKEMLEYCMNPFHAHVRATPLFEILGISLHCANPSLYDNGTVFEIYGVVRVTDEEGNTFDLYNQEQNSPEFISLGGNVSLSGRHCGIVSLSNTFMVELNLRDRARDMVIANGLFSMNCETKDDFEQIRVEHISGEQCCFAVVRCIALEQAVAASVEVFCETNNDQSDCAANIHGSIVASYGQNYKYSIKDNVALDVPKAAYTSCVLFDKSVNQSVQVRSETHIPLNRGIVAVPASTSLTLEVNLMECDSDDRYHNFVSEVVEFDVLDGEGELRVVRGQNGNIKVCVRWERAYIQLSVLTDVVHKRGPVTDLNKFVEVQKMIQFLSYLQPLSYLQSAPVSKNKRNLKRLGCSLIEVFSISIHPDNGEVHNLHGTITMCDRGGTFYMLNTDESSSEKSLHIVWPTRSFAATELEMWLNLKDGKEPISYGHLTWDCYSAEIPISWYHRRLSSVIRGRCGYAVVHYIFLKDALQGKLKILLCGTSSDDVCSSVWGRISAYYDDYKYSTCWERENYQSNLFTQSKEDSSQLTCGSEIPLSRSVIVVPTQASLIIEAELWVTSSPADAPEHVSGIVEIKGKMSNVKGKRRNSKFKGFIPKNHGTQKYHLEVCVECSCVPE